MEKIEETLKNYVLSNRLKTNIIDQKNNYSSADKIFGSMILSIAMDSEYKETHNLATILKKLFLNEFCRINPDCQYNDLNFDKSLQNNNPSESDMILKYKLLDSFLTEIITEKKSDRDYSELLEEANKMFCLFGNEDSVKNEEIFKFYYLNFGLKDKDRSGWDDNHWNVKSDRIETISEHVVGTMALALALQSKFKHDFDFDKILKMLAIHETGETLIGDITPFDGITLDKKQEIEHKAMADALGNLENKSELLELLFEFDEQKTDEAKFAYYCDKIEADLQAKIYQDKGLQHALNDQTNNCVFNSPKIQKMIQDGAVTAFDIWYFWDKEKYENDEIFPEFSKILEFANNNNLLELNKPKVKRKNS